MRRPPTERGFTLIESLVALAVLAVALLLGMGLVLQLPGVIRRVDAHRQALRAMEAALEALRAGELPLASGRLVSPSPVGSGGSSGSAPAGLAVWIEVQPVSPPGLHEVLVRARYPAAGKIVERQVATLVYRRPPAGPGPTTGPESP